MAPGDSLPVLHGDTDSESIALSLSLFAFVMWHSQWDACKSTILVTPTSLFLMVPGYFLEVLMFYNCFNCLYLSDIFKLYFINIYIIHNIYYITLRYIIRREHCKCQSTQMNFLKHAVINTEVKKYRGGIGVAMALG